MKINDGKSFQPVTITIETQGEADLLAAVVGVFGGDREDDMLYKIYCALDREGRKYKVTGGPTTIMEF